MVASPPVAMKVAVRCTGTLQGGELCNKLLFYLLADSPPNVEVKCPKCGTVAEFR